MAVNYTEEQVAVMITNIVIILTRETVEKLADELDKSVKSIIGKLSREGVYKKTEYTDQNRRKTNNKGTNSRKSRRKTRIT